MKQALSGKYQDTLIIYAALAPVLASPLYLMGYLGWAMSGGASAGSAKQVVLFLMVPVTSLVLLLAVLLFGRVTSRRFLGLVVAAVLNLAELLLGLKITASG